jgi:hypothetical protein
MVPGLSRTGDRGFGSQTDSHLQWNFHSRRPSIAGYLQTITLTGLTLFRRGKRLLHKNFEIDYFFLLRNFHAIENLFVSKEIASRLEPR